MSPEQPSQERQEQHDAASLYTQEIQEVIGTQRTVALTNAECFAQKQSRYLYGFTRSENPNEHLGFVKVARVESENPQSLHHQLQREARALEIANRLEIPTTEVFNSYQETTGNHAVLHLEGFDANEGVSLSSPEMIAGAPPEYGAWAAEALTQSVAKELPQDIDTSFLKRTDERNESAEKFWQTWQSDVAIVLQSLPETVREKIAALIQEAQTDIEPLINTADEATTEYFVLNDTTPGNTFFNDKEQKARLLDFEDAGATTNKELAWITSMSTFYGRSWPNQEMQREFLQSILKQASPDKITQEYTKLKAAAVFGATFFAKFAMEPEHPEHAMAVGLINHLEENIQSLTAAFKQQRT